MPRQQLALITSLIVEIDVYRASKGPPDIEGRFKGFYEELFWDSWEVEWTSDGEWWWIGPWEELAQSRRWKRLEIAVPKTWIQDFAGVVERRSQVEENRRYGLVPGVDLYPRGW
ncbi:hypothetical protein ASPCADRAFT_398248 [Aspergillus carbonarius ITEM 5010]|uniref:Uncharacterized protein n=1 Tax=Aspergillus carbonarius (strain ITEM 5010) TaxID=602072 RepID=A0A1R3RHA4_ASPC5|nr:hypothetical protein ASPCADRAFT_398248 [Aspergillus carbonarius ITEM 5010]